MTRDELAVLFDYDRWATDKLLEVVAGVPTADYERDLGSSHGGIRGTLVHTYGAGVVWLRRWLGESPTVPISEQDVPTFELLRRRWGDLQRDQSSFISSIAEDRLNAPLAYRDMKGNPYSTVLWKQMQHLVNHGSYHRGQVVTLLRLLGVRPVGTDLIHYYRQTEKHG